MNKLLPGINKLEVKLRNLFFFFFKQMHVHLISGAPVIYLGKETSLLTQAFSFFFLKSLSLDSRCALCDFTHRVFL